MKNILALSLLILFSKFANAQWLQLDQPTGGAYCWSLERINNNEIWAAYNASVFVSSNEGLTWHKHPFLNFKTMAIKSYGDTVAVLYEHRQGTTTNYDMMYMSSYDNGVTWNSPVLVMTQNSYFYSNSKITRGNSYLLASNSINYYVSYNLGQTWSPLTLPLGGNSMLLLNGDQYLLYNTYTTLAATYLSDNGGISWNLLDSNYSSQSALVINNFIYKSTGYTVASTYHSFIARTSDFGLTWDTLGLNIFNGTDRVTFFNGKIYATRTQSQPNLQYESSDGGNTWITSPVPAKFFWINDDDAIYLSNGEWLINNYSNLYRYNYGSANYFTTETGINSRIITYLQNNKGVLYAKADEIVYTSHNAGATWENIIGAGSDIVRPFFNGDTVLLISNSNKVCFTTDNGLTWDSMPGPFINVPAAVASINGRIIVTSESSYGCAYTDDWGATWDTINPVLTPSSCTSGNVYGGPMAVCNNELYMLDGLHDVICKYDFSLNQWEGVHCVSSPGVQHEQLITLDNYITYRGGSQFLVSSDSGLTWYTPANIGFPTGKLPRSVSIVNGVWFATTINIGGLYYSFDHGDNWLQYNIPINLVITSYGDEVVTALNGNLYLGGMSVWRERNTLQLITGNVYSDLNNNGVKDINENGIQGIILHTAPNNNAINTTLIGDYSFFTDAIGDTLKPVFPSPYSSVYPSYYLTNGAASNQDFGIHFLPGVYEMAADITNRTPFRNGFKTKLDVTVRNNGTVVIPTQLEVILDSSLTYISASVTPLINGDTLLFAVDSLDMFESRNFTVETEVNFMTPINTPIHCSAIINPVIGDTVPSNNFSEINAHVVGSYDPNDKSANYNHYITPTQVQNGDEMIYTIRFQNLGNFQADNIHIIDTISRLFDLSTFRIIASSHPMTYTLEGQGITTYYFDNIFLPAATADEPGSHGFVKYAVKCFRSLTLGTALENKAYIYFDFNLPILTNTATTLIAVPPINIGTEEISLKEYMSVYPNPVSDVLNGNINFENVRPYQLVIYNQQGKLIKSEKHNNKHFSIDISNEANGLYLGKVITPDFEKQLLFKFIISH